MIMGINWSDKLYSRKFWFGIATVVIGLVLCAAGDTENGMSLIRIGSVSYIGAECLVDVANAIFGARIEIADIIEEDEPEV